MRKISFKIISILIGLSLGLLLGEVVSRVYIFGMDGLSFKKIKTFTNLANSGIIKASTNQKILYELKPNINDYFKCKKLITNAAGCRDKDYSFEKPKNTIRGIVIGDSFTMGSGVNIEETYHSQMEKTLNQNTKGIQYELINLGVSGYNLLNYLGVLEEKVLKYDPDFLIIGFYSRNDVNLPRKRHYDGNYKVKEKSLSSFWTSFLGKLAELAFIKKSPYVEKDITDKQQEFISQMFSAYGTFSLKNNIPILLTYLSMEEDFNNLHLIKTIAEKNKLFFSDSKGKFDYNRPGKYVVSPLDSHPNKLGHQTFANTLLSSPSFLEIINKKILSDSLQTNFN